MDFFDKIKKIIENHTSDNSSTVEEAHTSDSVSTENDILSTGNTPFKPYFTVEDEYGDSCYSFELPRDFIEFNSHTEFMPSYIYDPFCTEEFTGYKENTPIIAIGPYDTIYDAIESYKETGTVSELEITVCENPCFLFSTKFEEYGEIIYAYAFADGSARESEMLCLQYPLNIVGTELEVKLMSALDHAAATYKEENL